MNKKKVALALAAALGINSLMVTVGTVNGQAVIAHAQEGRFSEENKEAANIVSVKTLDTTVVSVTQDETTKKDVVTLSFDGLNKDNVSAMSISNVKLGASTNSNVKLEWNADKAQAKVTGLDEAGVYTFDLKVTYKGDTTNTETYRITLKKTNANQGLSIGSVAVDKASVTINNLTFNSNAVSTQVVELHQGNTVYTGKVSSGNVIFNGVTNMEVGDVYTVVVKESSASDAKELGRIQIALTEQKEETKIEAFATNDGTNLTANLAKIQNDYGLTNTLTATDSNNDGVFEIKDGETEILSYVQTVAPAEQSQTVTYGGAALSIDNNTGDSKLKVSIDSSKTLGVTTEEANYIPNIKLPSVALPTQPGVANNSTFVYIGDYNITVSGSGINNTTNYSISDLTTGETKTYVSQDTTNSYLWISSGVTDLNGTDNGLELKGLSIADIDFGSLKQGYQSVGVTFNIEEGNISGKTISAWNAELSENFKLNPVKLDGPVSTSIIIGKDDIDGVAVNGTFTKKDSKTGTLTLTATSDIFKSIENNLSVLTDYVTVNGADVIFKGKGTEANSVEFNVTFKEEVPQEITWTLKGTGSSKLTNTIDTAGVETINLVKAEIKNNINAENGVYLDVEFGGLKVPTNSRLVLKDEKGTTIAETTSGRFSIDNVPSLNSGNYVIEVITTDGTYEVGILLDLTPISVEIKQVISTSNTGVTVHVDAFLNKLDPAKVTKAVVQYKEENSTTWNDKDIVEISRENIKEEEITVNVPGLQSGKKYDFRAVYTYKADDQAQEVIVYSKVVSQVISSTNSDDTISGSGGSSTSGSSISSTTVNVTTSNSEKGATSIGVTIPSSVSYDSGKTPVSSGFKYRDNDGKVVTESKEQYSNVTASFENGKVVLHGLVPGKDYSEISVDYTDKNGRTRTLVLKNVKVDATTELESYLANVYTVVFTRPADEAGYHFHLSNLKDKKTSLREFLLNMLNEKEFVETYKTTETKIEALYNAIVNRDSDSEGKAFWVSEYKKLLSVYGSEAATLQAIADRMVNEGELKELATKLDVQW